jgi:WD40 repeat protein
VHTLVNESFWLILADMRLRVWKFGTSPLSEMKKFLFTVILDLELSGSFLSLSGDGQFLAISVGSDLLRRIPDRKSAESQNLEFAQPTMGIITAVFSPISGIIAAGYTNGTTIIFYHGESAAELLGGNNTITTLAFSPDGERLVSVSFSYCRDVGAGSQAMCSDDFFNAHSSFGQGHAGREICCLD